MYDNNIKTKICNDCKEEKFTTEFTSDRSVCKKCVYIKYINKIKELNTNITLKICKQCNKNKNIGEFYITSSICKECSSQYSKNRNKIKKEKDKILSQDTYKICTKCNNSKIILDFYPGMTWCKQCTNKNSIENGYKRRDKDKSSEQNILRCCTKCNIQKILSEFHRGMMICKECRSEYKRNFHPLNPQKRLLQGAKSRASEENLPFNLSEEDIIIPEFCPDLGIKIFVSVKKLTQNSPTIDRIIPELGYIKDNIRVVSYKANRLKAETTILIAATMWKYVLDSFPSDYIIDNETKNYLEILYNSIIKLKV